MPLIAKQYILLFFVSSIIGWCMEVVCKLIQFRRFINRGFLIGPYCPIYGFGAVLVTALLSRYADSPVAVFVLAMVVSGILEYLTSFVMEKLFHARWWDYSQKRFNLNGRVCANTLIPFGLMGLMLIYVVKPFFFGWFATLPDLLLNILCYGLIAILAVDTALSSHVLSKIRQNANHVQGDSTEDITRAVRARLAQEGALVRRTLRAFPYAKLYSQDLQQKLKQQRQALQREMKAAREKTRQDIRQREEKLRADVAALKEKRDRH